MSHKDLSSMPPEILQTIIGYLTYSDLKNFMLVSKQFREFGDDPDLWKNMHLHVRKNIPVASIPRLQKIKRVTLHGELGYQPSESFLLQLQILNCTYLRLVKTELTSI